MTIDNTCGETKNENEKRKEKGLIYYAFSVELHNDNNIRITELWEDVQSLKDHLKTDHILNFLKEISETTPPKTEAHFFEATEIPYPDGELPKEVQG